MNGYEFKIKDFQDALSPCPVCGRNPHLEVCDDLYDRGRQYCTVCECGFTGFIYQFCPSMGMMNKPSFFEVDGIITNTLEAWEARVEAYKTVLEEISI
jgi:hypothetical protein